VLALTSSYPYAVADAHATLPAVLWTAHGGQASGTALAGVLFADVCPSGRLPQTWYASDRDLPDLLDYDLITAGATYLYFRGTPLYPFGHGLSFTSFSYGGLSTTVGESQVTATVTVTNTGEVAGTETVQLYARPLLPRVPRPHRALVAHRRVPLRPGESATVTLTVPRESLGFWDVAHRRWTVDPGRYEFQAGASSADIRVTRTFDLDGAEPAPRPVLRLGLPAADFDSQRGIVLADRSRERGDVVTPADSSSGGLLVFRDCDFGPPGPARARLRVALADGAGAPASVELRLGDGKAQQDDEEGGATGAPVACAPVPVTGDGYTYTEVTVDCAGLSGVRDLSVTLRGPVRLDRIDFER
jgi:beta-glucosidase